MMSVEDKRDIWFLPIFLPDKIEFILVLNNLKRGGEFVVNYIDESIESNLIIVENFLIKNKMKYFIKSEKKEKRVIYYYSKSQYILNKLVDVYCTSDKYTDEEKSLILGDIYSFPKKAVVEYSRMMKKNDGMWSDKLEKESDFEKKHGYENWAAYMTYVARVGHVEDYEIAKKWSECLNNQFPELDIEYQKVQKNWMMRIDENNK